MRVTRSAPLLVVLAVQAALSASMLRDNTAFGDEALYLSAGHLEWSHWLHGTPVPAYQDWFSGAPVLYPPVGALADSLGGLTAARALALLFMLGTTCFLWAITRNLLNGRCAAFFAAAIFAVLAPTLHLGAFATYDAPALFLLAAATWCATKSADSTKWIIAAGALLALANATKYATALFDPTVLAVTLLNRRPGLNGRPGKTTLKQAALLTGTAAVLIAALLALGGPGYLTGIRLTTTGRPHGTDTAALVISHAWAWTAVVLVPAVAGAALALYQRNEKRWLLAVLALSALLAPADQARIDTTVSLNKHVDFGAWFAAIAAGYLLSQLSRTKVIRYTVVAALVPVTVLGTAQARAMVDWPNVTQLVKVVKPLVKPGDHYLVETTDVLQYYLPDTTWPQWLDTDKHSPQYYEQEIARHHYNLVILSFDQTPAADYAIGLALSKAGGFIQLPPVRAGKTTFHVWEYLGLV